MRLEFKVSEQYGNFDCAFEATGNASGAHTQYGTRPAIVYAHYVEPGPTTIQYELDCVLKGRYDVIFPHLYFVSFFIEKSNWYNLALISKEKMKSPDDLAGGLPFYNTHHRTGHLCFASLPVLGEPLKIQARNIMLEFLGGRFHHTINVYAEGPSGVPKIFMQQIRDDAPLEKWAKFSEDNGVPGILALPWNTYRSFRDFVQNLLNGNNEGARR